MPLKETRSYILLGYDTYPSLQTNLLGNKYLFNQINLRGEIISRIHENVINIIINNPEKINFRRNLHRKEKKLRQENEFC